MRVVRLDATAIGGIENGTYNAEVAYVVDCESSYVRAFIVTPILSSSQFGAVE